MIRRGEGCGGDIFPFEFVTLNIPTALQNGCDPK